MPGVLEDIAARLAAMELSLTEVAVTLREQARPVCPMTSDEEVWAAGALTVKEACAFVGVKSVKLFELMKSGELVSALDGRRLIARRGSVRYLLSHQAHRGGVLGDGTQAVWSEQKKPTPKKGKKRHRTPATREEHPWQRAHRFRTGPRPRPSGCPRSPSPPAWRSSAPWRPG